MVAGRHIPCWLYSKDRACGHQGVRNGRGYEPQDNRGRGLSATHRGRVSGPQYAYRQPSVRLKKLGLSLTLALKQDLIDLSPMGVGGLIIVEQ